MNQADIYEYLKSGPQSQRADIIVVKDDKDAEKVYDIANILDLKCFVLPQIRVEPGEDLRSYSDEIRQFLVSLGEYYRCPEHKFIVSPFATLTIPFPKERYFSRIKLEFADTFERKSLADILYFWGYHFVDIVTSPGEISIRGDVADIFSPSAKMPWRVNLFDDEVETIYEFDPVSQKRIGDELESIHIDPAFLALDRSEYEQLLHRIRMSSYESFVKDIDSLGLWLLGPFSDNFFISRKAIKTGDVDSEIDEFYSFATPFIDKSSFPETVIPSAKKWRELEIADINAVIKTQKGKRITVIARSESLVRGSGITDMVDLNYIYKEGIVNLASDEEAILSLNKHLRSKRKIKKAKIVLDELKTGDYVVHESHGVGIFRGVEKRDVLGVMKEFIVIGYFNDDLLLVPVESLNLIDRYVAESGSLPVLDRLGKASFKKLKEKTRAKLFEIASHIIGISAKRVLKKGKVIRVDPAEHAVFMSQAGFEHTDDQKKAIKEMLSDLESGMIMDRLLSADVGFGKTEVAMNAIFAVVRCGYQAMLIVPTTLLSSQHFATLKKRFSEWDIKIAKLDRYTSAKEKRSIVSGMDNGSIDVVVGTHALLKANFKNLGLVVVDEEHKFGVKQKEALKNISIDVHMLSMSATPIPRSLNMALSKLKGFSEILTPPLERIGVRTFVKSYDPKIVKEAILRERRRGGQIFYIYNSIAEIEQKAEELREIIPDIRLFILHSKISASKTEEEMLRFANKEYDLLLSTTIVESGIHLPNVNTMLVDGAENFGIADLHQLRGRVGRGGKEGYCYMLVEDKEKLKDNSKKRLLALETHSDLGSGAILAFHDLEIRGAGNLIGEAQSGHIKQIGYSLYLRMLEDAIRELSGEREEDDNIEIKLQVNAYLNDQLIPEDRLRLELYRRLAQAGSVSEVYEIEEEIRDRFGRPDDITLQYIELMAIKVLAKEHGISKISSFKERIFIEYRDGRERTVLEAPSQSDDDVLSKAKSFLLKNPAA